MRTELLTGNEIPEDYCPPVPDPQQRPLGALRLLLTLRRNPLECWAREHFEKLVVFGGLPFRQVVVINDPNAIRRVLVENTANYQKDVLQRRVLSAGLGEGLLSAEQDRWRAQRRTLAPLFTPRVVRGFAPAMVDAAAALAARWEGLDGAVADIAAEMRRLTLDVLQRTIFSDGLGRDTEQFREAMATYFDTVGRIGLFDVIAVPAFIPRLKRLRVRSALRFFECAIDEMIMARRARSAECSCHHSKDILDLLLDAVDPETGERMSASEIRSNVLTFISAGHETTANALTWSLFLLSQSPRWLSQVEAEVSAGSSTAQNISEPLVLTRAVIEEAIRLYPPIAAISRVAMAADELAGEPIPAGCIVVIAPYVLHRHHRVWDRPGIFDPSRFLPGAREQINRYAYMPFGIGPRTCIGSTFALQEATLVLAAIVREFKFALAPGFNVEPVLRMTLRPARGLAMIVNSKLERRRHMSADRAGNVAQKTQAVTSQI
jgi:cytochrome P450